jgi:putative Mn2+ efflux pump MntP
MDWLNLFGLAAALAMDAFAVAVVTGLTLDALTKRRVFRLSFHFGLFQALMPTLGWLAGMAVQKYVAAYDHWVAFGLLVFVGGRMVFNAVRGEEAESRMTADPTKGLSLVLLSVATSIDALAVGLSLALIGSAILVPVVVIGIVAAAFTVLGMHLGRRIGKAWGRKVEILGGIILIAIGIKIILEHLPA